jgi:hypothetical protein
VNTIAVRLAQARVDEAAWPVPLHLESYDRRVALAEQELDTLLELGPLHLRRSRARGAQQRTTSWELLARLVTPLDDARTLLHHGDEVRYRRASTHAAGLVLQHCADTGRSYWGWTATDWATLACPTTRQFIAARSVPVSRQARIARSIVQGPAGLPHWSLARNRPSPNWIASASRCAISLGIGIGVRLMSDFRGSSNH